MVDPDGANRVLEFAEPLQLGETSQDSYDISLKHKFGEPPPQVPGLFRLRANRIFPLRTGDPITTTCNVRISGTESVRIIQIDLKLTEQAKAAIFTVSAAGKITYCNVQLSVMLGYSEKELKKVRRPIARADTCFPGPIFAPPPLRRWTSWT